MFAARMIAIGISVVLLSGCVSSPWFDGPYPPAAAEGGVNATFLGVSTVVFETNGHAVATDGFFSRPDTIALVRVGPNRTEIDRIWNATGIATLDAVVTVHSHYDHAMDAPVLAQKLGAELIGSQSTKFIADGVNFSGTFRLIQKDKPTSFLVPQAAPVFKITTVRSVHGDTPFSDQDVIKKKLVPPVLFTEYKEGGCYSIFIEFLQSKRTVLVQAGAGYIPGNLAGRKADVVYLGIVPLGNMEERAQEAYWREVVEAVGARRVFPIHWDHMFDRLEVGEEELKPLPRVAHDFDRAMKFLEKKSKETGVQVVLPRAWRKTDPFADLPPAPLRQVMMGRTSGQAGF